MVNHCASCVGPTLEAMSNALIRTSFTASGTWDSWSCSTDRALAPFERRRSECVSHAEWRTDVLYGGSNIVLGCLHCTWWYGANRGICQMQSGVMERRDRAWIEKREGSGGSEQLEPWQTPLRASAVGGGGQRPKHAPIAPWGRLCSVLRGAYYLQHALITQERISKSHHSTLQEGYLNCGWFTVNAEMLGSEKRCPWNAQIFENATRSDFNQR